MFIVISIEIGNSFDILISNGILNFKRYLESKRYVESKCYLESMSDARRQRLSRPESQARTRDQLLATARDLFIRRGYGATSIRDIAETAGFSQGAFYSNFPGKEDVLLELLRRHKHEEAKALAALLEPPEMFGDDILAALDNWATTMNADVDWAMLSVELGLQARRSPAVAAVHTALHAEELRLFGGLIARLFDRLGRRPEPDPETIAQMLIALAHGLALQPANPPVSPGRIIMQSLRSLIAAAPPEPRS